MCGTVPLIWSRQGVPAYESLFGKFPSVDIGKLTPSGPSAAKRGNDKPSAAGRLAELTRTLRRLAEPDAYRDLIRGWLAPFDATRYDPPSFHCAWFAAAERMWRTPKQALAQPRCIDDNGYGAARKEKKAGTYAPRG